VRPVLLHLDSSLHAQPELCEGVRARGGSAVNALELGPALRLWSRSAALDTLRDRLQQGLRPGPVLAFAGSGDFHHVSALLIERAVEQAPGPVTVVHFDNHPDWVRFADGMHCGSWVGRAARLRGVARVITVGVCSSDIRRPRGKGADLALIEEDRLDLYPYRVPGGGSAVRLCGREWPSIESVGIDAFHDVLRSRLDTRCLYITIDKDVLRADDAVTNWDQGCTTLELLVSLVRTIAAQHEIVGADVVGDWSEPVYDEGVHRWMKRLEAMIDQPWRRPSSAALAVNESVNVTLLQLFTEVAG
jgi:hypothetical protein